MKKSSSTPAFGLLVLALICLANPNANLIDIFPDFIAYAILCKLFEKGRGTVPFFEEAAADFKRLTLLDLCKLPALAAAVAIRSSGGGNDTFTLFAFLFAAAEGFLSFRAAVSSFNALFYLGARAQGDALISPFGKGKTPEKLRTLTLIFVVCKSLAAFVPDLFLLTGSLEVGIGKNLDFYPAVLAVFLAVTLALGVLFAVYAVGYAKAVHRTADFASALAALTAFVPVEERNKKREAKRVSLAFSLLVWGFIFLLNPTVSSLSGISVLPNFAFGLFAFFALRIFKEKLSLTRAHLALPLVFSGVSLACYVCEDVFLANYGFSALVSNDNAKAAFRLPAILEVAEFLAFLAAIAAVTAALCRFAARMTGSCPADRDYRPIDAEFHRTEKRRALLLGVCAALTAAAKCAGFLFNGIRIFIATDSSSGLTASQIQSGLFPGFGVVKAVLGVLTVFFAYCLFDNYKEEYRTKFGVGVND